MFVILFLFSHLLSAQSITPDKVIRIRQAIGVAISPLDKSQISTGYLFEYGYFGSFNPLKVNGIRQDSNQVNFNSWAMVYNSLYVSNVSGTQKLPTTQEVETRIDTYRGKNAPITFAILSAKYNSIKANAVSSGLLTTSNKKFYDVPNRTQSPYVNHDAFIVAPIVQTIDKSNVDFIFRRELFFNNYDITSSNVTNIEVNFDDGQGLRQIIWNTPINISYNSSGKKKLVYRFTFAGNIVRESHSFLIVDFVPIASSNVLNRYNPVSAVLQDFPATMSHSGANVSVIYSSLNATSPRKLRKPLIVAEGFDPVAIRVGNLFQIGGENFSIITFLSIFGVTINNSPKFTDLLDDTAGYDLVFIDYKDGADAINRNAALFKDVIRWVNANKDASAQQNVVLGLEMGGLVARLGLAQMVLANEDTKTRLLLTHDTPHRGLNIPLGVQALSRMYTKISHLPLLPFSILKVDVLTRLALYESPAMKNMLIYRALDVDGGTAENDFIPQYQIAVNIITPYDFVASSSGAECGQWISSKRQLLYEDSFDVGPGSQLLGNNFMGVLVDDLTWAYHIEAKAYNLPPSGQTTEIAKLSVDFKQIAITISSIISIITEPWKIFEEILFEIFIEITIQNTLVNDYHFEAPASAFSVDVAPGSALSPTTYYLYDSKNVKSSYIPVASALNVPLNETNLFSSYNTNFISNVSLGGSNRPKNFITQEPQNFGANIEYNRDSKSAPTSRLALWMYREMEGIPQTELCGRPCPPSGLADINISNALMCVGEERVLTNDMSWTNIVITTSANLVYNARPNRSVTAIGKGYAWIIIKAMVNDCEIPLKSIYLWIGEPYGTNAIRLIGMENPQYAPNGALQVCSGSQLTFETDFDLLPNGADAGITAFEWDGATIVSQDDNLTDQDFSDQGTGTNSNPHISAIGEDPKLKPRTSRVTIKFPMFFTTSLVTLRVRLKNRCGVSEWMEYAIIVDVDYCYSGGTPIGPGAGPWDIITPVAFENPIGSGRLKMRLNGIPDVDYNNLDPKTLAGFTYQIKLYNNQGDEKLIWEGNTVESDADVSFLQQGLYSAKVVFGNGQCVKNIHLIKQ